MPKRKHTRLKQKTNKKRKIEPEISMTMLPNEIIQLILKNISDNDLRNLAMVNNVYNALVEEEYKLKILNANKSITHPVLRKRLSYAHFFNSTQFTLTDFCKTLRLILTKASFMTYGNETWYPNLDFSYMQQGKEHDFHALYERDPDDEEDNLLFIYRIYRTMLTKALDLLGDFYPKKYDALNILKCLVEDLKKHAVDINYKGPFGQSLLHFICSMYSKQFFNDDCITFLIEEGARVTLKDDYEFCAYEILFQHITQQRMQKRNLAAVEDEVSLALIYPGISLKLFKLIFEQIKHKTYLFNSLFENTARVKIGGKGKGYSRHYISINNECINYLSNYPEGKIRDQFLKLAEKHHITLMAYPQENLGHQNKL